MSQGRTKGAKNDQTHGTPFKEDGTTTYYQYPIYRCADQHGAYSHRSAATACIVVKVSEHTRLGLGTMLAIEGFCKVNRLLEHLPEKNAEKHRIPKSISHTKRGLHVPNPNSRGHATKRGLGVPKPNSRGRTTKRPLRVPNPNSRGYATHRVLRVPNPNSRGYATHRVVRVPNPNSRGHAKKRRL